MAAKVDARALGLTAGIIWGTAVAFLELMAGTEYGERWRRLLADLYPGYSPKPGDLVWGTVLGFTDAYILGYLFGRLYNRLAE
ncbi:bacteriophage holin [Halalkaliarchaeum desulfuricum]|uniref:bacteriophage holin n=1 Tax=Halalkaliarchaeum desulfuricum TaxID=2055893 RepID=UPI000E6BB786|nr:bacteriophage holin [Halalkaliarchaeum desulfuricum]